MQVTVFILRDNRVRRLSKIQYHLEHLAKLCGVKLVKLGLSRNTRVKRHHGHTHFQQPITRPNILEIATVFIRPVEQRL